MTIVAQPKSYSDILVRVFFTTLLVGIYCTWLLEYASHALSQLIRSTEHRPSLSLVLVLTPLAVAILSRAITLHDRISDALRIREHFDTHHILRPLAEQTGHTVDETRLAALKRNRTQLMRAAFYRFASFISPLIDEQLVRSAADNWGWLWSAVEATFLLLFTTSLLIFVGAWRLALTAALLPSLLLLPLMLYLRRACRETATHQVQAIAENPDFRLTAFQAFAPAFGLPIAAGLPNSPRDPPDGRSESVTRVEYLRENARIGIITALEKEFVAVEAMIESRTDWVASGTGAGRRYVLGAIPAKGLMARAVVLAMLPDMGNNNAAIRATQLFHHFPNLRHVIMCGIAGGIPAEKPDEHVRLGDIVVSNKGGVVQYDLVKVTEGAPEEHRYPPRPPSSELLEAHRFLTAGVRRNERPWENFIARGAHLEGANRPTEDTDASGAPISHPADPKRRAGFPRAFEGPIASANKLLKDSSLRDLLRRKFGAYAVEMEASGIADADWVADRAGYLVIRGICDYCDTHKGDLWQAYSAVAAAAYLRALLESMPLADGEPSVDPLLLAAEQSGVGAVGTTPEARSSAAGVARQAATRTEAPPPPTRRVDLLHFLEAQFNIIWEPSTHDGEPTDVFWPVRLRKPTLIHAAQAFVAAALQKTGCRVHLCLDDFGRVDCGQDVFIDRMRKHFSYTGANFDVVDVTLAHSLIEPTALAATWSAFSRWMSNTESLRETLGVCKLLAPEPLDMNAVLSRKPRKLMTPAVVWTCLAECMKSSSQATRWITLGGHDERPLWETWRATFAKHASPIAHLYVPQLESLSKRHQPGHLAMADEPLSWRSRGDIVTTLGLDDVGPADATHLLGWLILLCMLLPARLRGKPLELCAALLHGKADLALLSDIDRPRLTEAVADETRNILLS